MENRRSEINHFNILTIHRLLYYSEDTETCMRDCTFKTVENSAVFGLVKNIHFSPIFNENLSIKAPVCQ